MSTKEVIITAFLNEFWGQQCVSTYAAVAASSYHVEINGQKLTMFEIPLFYSAQGNKETTELLRPRTLSCVRKDTVTGCLNENGEKLNSFQVDPEHHNPY